jgi:hypothetical protein
MYNKILQENGITIYVDKEGNAINIYFTENSSPYYREWIKDEGADIALYRQFDNNKIIGIRLPYNNSLETK